MKTLRICLGALVLLLFVLPVGMMGQKDKDNEPTTWINFVVVRDENGKPVRNAAVIMHPVNPRGKQEKGGMELKTDSDGKCDFDGIPYGMLRVQVLAAGFQTYGEDYDIEKPKTELTIKLKKPSGQYSIYQDHPQDSSGQSKADPNQKKPN